MSQRRGMESETHVSASQFALYMKGLDFPADRETIVEQARSNGAPENVMEFFERLPEKEYHYPTDVEKEFGRMK